ncbi:HAMP domain-containing sensor histidine kinase [Nocardioides sp.]|uniref:HAMP domain-containing sensor histidine kinase n=1 Tax=Nocardioides sp. TaxID=35761 RepID=UPI002F3FB958
MATLTSALLVLGVQVLLRQTNDATVRARLADRAATAATSVRVTPSGIRVREQGLTLLQQDAWIFDVYGRMVAGRLPASNDRYSDDVRELASSTTARRLTDEDLVLLAQPVVRDGSRVATVVVSEDLGPYEGSERHSLWLTLALAAVAVFLATTAAWIAARHSLLRVRAMSDTADEWREHDLGARFNPGPGGDEIAHLGRTLDTMLDRIAETLSAERRLTDEIAHELRTPLAIVLAEADLAREGATDDQRATLEAIRDAALRMRSAIDTMLTVARARTDVRRVSRIGDLVAALDQPSTGLDDLLVPAPTPLLVAAVKPLMENAQRHGGGDPRLEVTREVRHVVVSVMDDGPGVPADEVEAVFEPGHSTRADGSGLGLPLARRMARAVGGELVARPGPGGRFELRLPLH